MNYKEIKEKLKEIGLDGKKLGLYAQNGECMVYDDETGDEIEYDVEGLLEEHLGKFEVAETSYFHDGYECWCVYAFKEHNVFIKMTGYFSSYDDTEWGDFFEVVPEQKTITVYEKPKKQDKNV